MTFKHQKPAGCRIYFSGSSPIIQNVTQLIGAASNSILYTNGSGVIISNANLLFSTTTGYSQTSTSTASSGTATGHVINYTINQSGIAGYACQQINLTKTATGSGSKYFYEATVGGSTVYGVLDNGVLYITATTAPGSTVATITNSPGVNSTPTGWITVNISGSTAYVPYFT